MHIAKIVHHLHLRTGLYKPRLYQSAYTIHACVHPCLYESSLHGLLLTLNLRLQGSSHAGLLKGLLKSLLLVRTSSVSYVFE